MRIEEIKISELKQYENNPRKNDGAVEAVANSIKEFGFKVPIIIDSENVIIAGHTRLKAASKLGLASVPCIIADDLTDDQIKAFRLADNKTSELAEWDFSKLETELSEMEFDMKAFGFYDFEENYFDDLFEPKEPQKRTKEPETITEKPKKEQYNIPETVYNNIVDNDDVTEVTEEHETKPAFVVSVEFEDEKDASDLIAFLDDQDYIYKTERG